MSRVNDVHSEIWSTEEFLELSPPAKLLYFWAFTNADNPMSGIYRVARRVMSFATGLSLDEVDEALQELQAARFVLYADGIMFVRARVKRLRTQSEQIARSIARDVLALSVDSEVRAAFFAEYGDDREWGEGRLFARLHGEFMEARRLSGEPHLRVDGKSETFHGQGLGQGGEKNQDAGRARPRRTPKPPAPDELPADLADELRPVAEMVAATLARVAEAKGARPVTLAAVGSAVRATPSHDHLAIVGDFEHYWVHGQGANTPRSDIVQTYRNRLQAVGPRPAGSVTALRPSAAVRGSGDAMVAASRAANAEREARAAADERSQSA